MEASDVRSHQRRAETLDIARERRDASYRETRRLMANAWTAPLWSHAMPAWRGSTLALELSGNAELIRRREAVDRWRGLDGEAAD